MPTECVIEFENNPSMVFYTGQLLRGNVRLSLTESKSVRGVYIKIMGIGYVHWTSGSGDNRRSYTGNENYLHERTYLVGSQSGEFQLMAGTYNYTFQCLLPRQLPTSIEGHYGHIRYTATVVLDIPLWPDKEFEVPFTVIKANDLNADLTLREPVIVEIHEKFLLCCLLCCTESEPMDIAVRIPVGGYTPGQTINLLLNVKNESTQPVSEFKVRLMKKIDYYANSSRHNKETITVVKNVERGCDMNQERIIHSNILVPSIPPTDNETSLIKVQYYILVTGSVECCHPDPELKIPIVIGSHPISDDVISREPTVFPTAPMVVPPMGMPMLALPTNGVITQQPTAPSAILQNRNATVSNVPTAPFPNDDPPTYEEAMQFGNAETNFRPKYPMFKRTTSYSSADNL